MGPPQGRLVIGYAARRALLGLFVLGAVAVFVFVSFRFVPGDVVNRQLEEAGAATPELIAEKRAELGLDEPILTQFVVWAGNVVRGDLGNSLWTGRPVAAEVGRAIVPTLQLSVMAIVIGFALGVASGTASAIWREKPADYLLRVVSTTFLAIPHLWLGLLILSALAAVGYFAPLPFRPLFSDPLTNLEQTIVPAAAMALGVAAALSRLTRSSMLEVLGSDYIRAGRARGLGAYDINFRHGVKNAMIPLLTLVGIQFSHLLSGTVIIERIFNIPGLGSLLFESVANRDYTLIQAIVLVYGLIAIVVNLVVDLSYGLVDPRIREAHS